MSEISKLKPELTKEEILERVKLVVHIDHQIKPQKHIDKMIIEISDEEVETIQTLLYCHESLLVNQTIPQVE